MRISKRFKAYARLYTEKIRVRNVNSDPGTEIRRFFQKLMACKVHEKLEINQKSTGD